MNKYRILELFILAVQNCIQPKTCIRQSCHTKTVDKHHNNGRNTGKFEVCKQN